MSHIILQKLDGNVTRLCLNKAPVNAMTPDFLQEIEQALKEVDADTDVKAVIIASDLAVLSAGVDLKQAVDFSDDEQSALLRGFDKTFYQQYGMSKPVIAEVSGPAIAGGFFLVLCADYSVARKGASFALAEVKVGVTFPQGLLEIISNSMSPPVQRRMILSGDFIPSGQALHMGIIDEEVDGTAEEIQAAALKAAKRYAKLPPKTFNHVKQQLRGECLEKVKTIIANYTDGNKEAWFNNETVDAMNAMIAATAKK